MRVKFTIIYFYFIFIAVDYIWTFKSPTIFIYIVVSEISYSTTYVDIDLNGPLI